MNDWAPLAFTIVFVAVVSGALRRRFAPLPGERRRSGRQAAKEGSLTLLIIAAFLTVGLVILAGIAAPKNGGRTQQPQEKRAP